MSSRSLLLFCLLLLPASICEGQYRNYSLRCLAPILDSIDSNAPKTLSEAFLGGPTEFAEPLEGIGVESIDFPISTDSEEAQRFFHQGIALLHVLWYREAERAFRTVVELDPDCPMGYWGLAQANERSPQRAKIFAEAARDRCDGNRPEIERRWTSLVADFYSSIEEETISNRSSSRVRNLEELALDFPENREIKAFLIRRLTLDQFVAGLPVTSTLGVDTLAAEFAEDAPTHPSLHYRVFLWMNRRPERLLEEAMEMTTHSPGAAEIWRYAAEAHSAAGRLSEAVLLAQAAIQTDHLYLQERGLMPWEAQNLLPNQEAHIHFLVNAGRINEALAWVRNAISQPRSLVGNEARVERLWAESLMSAGQWNRLRDDLTTDRFLNASEAETDRALRLMWEGSACLALGQSERVEQVAAKLAVLERDAIIAGISTASENEISRCRKQLSSLRQLFAADAKEPDPGSLDKVDLPPLASARFYEIAGRKSEAFRELEIDIEKSPYRWLPTADYCRLAMETGQKRKALFHFDRRFRMDAEDADANLPVMDELDSIAENLSLTEKWILAAPTPSAPSGKGPKKWQAPTAPDFTLVDRLGDEMTLSQFSGRPVILNFFLGVQCAFCLQQIDSFQPYLPSFSEAGIEFIAVSIDSRENLRKILGSEEAIEPAFRDRFPFPVLADPDLDVFRKYGVFDDFENGPMHATVLIGPAGDILWRNIGHIPFQEPKLLLNEARRLLIVRKPG